MVDFINCRISEKSEDGPPTADDLVVICKSVGVKVKFCTGMFFVVNSSLKNSPLVVHLAYMYCGSSEWKIIIVTSIL